MLIIFFKNYKLRYYKTMIRKSVYISYFNTIHHCKIFSFIALIIQKLYSSLLLFLKIQIINPNCKLNKITITIIKYISLTTSM